MKNLKKYNCNNFSSLENKIEQEKLLNNQRRKWKCEFCPEVKFLSDSEYTEHAQKHHKGKTQNYFMCSECGKQFKTRSELTHHIKSKCGTVKQYHCKECGQQLMTPGSLHNHMLRHTGKRSFMCRFCAKLFLTGGQLKVHERIHTKDKAFVCEVCGKGFCHRQSLITHSTLHTGIKPYQCENCGNAFSCIGNLLKHRKTHSDSCGLLPLTTHTVQNPTTKIKVKINTPETSKLKLLEKNKRLQRKLESLQSIVNNKETENSSNFDENCGINLLPGLEISKTDDRSEYTEEKELYRQMIGPEAKISIDSNSKKANATENLEEIVDPAESNVTSNFSFSTKPCLNLENLETDPGLQTHSNRSSEASVSNYESEQGDRDSSTVMQNTETEATSEEFININQENCPDIIEDKNSFGTENSYVSIFEDDIQIALEDANIKYDNLEVLENKRDGMDIEGNKDENREQRDNLFDPNSDSDNDYKDAVEDMLNCDTMNSSKDEKVVEKDIFIEAKEITETVKKKGTPKKPTKSKNSKNFAKELADFINERKLEGETKVKCKFCGKEYTHIKCLYRHELEHCQNDIGASVNKSLPNLPFKCSCCKKCFQTREECRNHQQSAHADKLTCQDCDKIFANTDSLKTHRQIFHKGIPRKMYMYICEKCGKKFKQKPLLSLHESQNCDNGPFFKCSVCNKEFISSHTMKAHMRIHDSEKKLLCKFCGKRFHWKGQLKVHERSHTGEKPYTCLFCPKAFAYRDSLITHSSKHTGIKPHFCEGCGWRFSCLGNLIKHKATHASTCGAWYQKNDSEDK